MPGERILTLRLEGVLRGKLDKLAAATRRSSAIPQNIDAFETMRLKRWVTLSVGIFIATPILAGQQWTG